MKKFNRDLQNEILKACCDAYPSQTTWQQFTHLFGNTDHKDLSANIVYLASHELITIESNTEPESYALIGALRATHKGIDFMLNDGGLSAILNVTTIKFHREAVVVLEDLIAISSLNDTDKEKAKSTLGELSNEALKTVVQTVTTAGLSMLIK